MFKESKLFLSSFLWKCSWLAMLFVLLWLAMVVLSLFHLLGWFESIDHLYKLRGCLAWATCIGVVFCLGKKWWWEISSIALLFLILGYVLGSYLEPPADPLDHLRNAYAMCQQGEVSDGRVNRGFWQYSMVGLILCSESGEKSPISTLHRIDLANGIFWAMAAAILYLLSRRAGLPARWSGASVVIAWLFMGTNVFSYFRYYSFAPSFTSLWIYWFWITVFFFKNRTKDYFIGLVTAVSAIPVLVANHIQESVFLVLIVIIWILFGLLVKFNVYLRQFSSKTRLISKISVYGSIFIILWVLPQFQWFQGLLSHLFIHSYWYENQEAVLWWQGFHIMGKIWSYRVNDTLGFAGFLPIILVPFFVIRGKANATNCKNEFLLLLGLIPFFIYCIPLFHFAWLSNCIHMETYIRYYYRICYASLFWIPIASFLYFVENWLSVRMRAISALKMFACIVSIFTLCLVATKRSSPVYGKFDFLLVNGKPWWPLWQEVVDYSVMLNNKQLFTDYTTGYVLNGVFNVPVFYKNFNITTVDETIKINVRKAPLLAKENGAVCLVNLLDFTPSWVPVVSGHWDRALASTSTLYDNIDDAVGCVLFTNKGFLNM